MRKKPKVGGRRSKTEQKKKSYSLRELARLAECDRESVPKWLEQAGLKAPYGEEALETLRARALDTRHSTLATNLDPATGLTWFQAKQKEDALKQRRLNEIADKTKSEEWMATTTHHAILSLIIGRLEQLPGRLKSQLGLNTQQTLVLQKAIDEVRTDSADDVEQAKDENPKAEGRRPKT